MDEMITEEENTLGCNCSECTLFDCSYKSWIKES